MENDIESLAIELHQILREKRLMLTTAESCTGGWIAKILTDTAGSSATFERGFVTYSNDAKQDMLGVTARTLRDHGAVSKHTVVEMAQGALRHSHASVSVAVSGIAGPSGGSQEKPVGTVWFAWARMDFTTKFQVVRYAGNRDSVRRQAVEQALSGLIDLVQCP